MSVGAITKHSMMAYGAKAHSTLSLLLEVGAIPGRPIAARTDSAAVLSVLGLATAALGAPLFPLDPALPDDVVSDLLEQTGATLWVGTRALSEATLLQGPSAPPPPSRRCPDDIALLIATSGSSGRPKAVMLTESALTAAARASATRTPLGAGDRWLICLPLFYIGGQAILSRCAKAGAEAVLHQGFDAKRVATSLDTQRISHLSLVPTMLARLLDLSHAPPSTLRHVLVGGSALSTDLAERAIAGRWPIQPTYGMSETASQVATLAAMTIPWRQGAVGSPLPGVEVALTEDGRLKVRGPMLMAGYANPTLTRGDGLEDGWFFTNDLVEITSDGDLVILGRADDVIISGGKKLVPAMIETLLAPCPGLDAVAVVGRADPIWGAVVAAIYQGQTQPQALLDWSRNHLPGWLRPRLAIPVTALPILTNGKPDRSALRRIAAEHQAESGTGRQP